MSGHERWRDDVAAHMLGALEPEQAAELERHAEGCERCREDMRWLAPAVQALPEGVPRRQPPPRLRERLLAEVRADAAAAGTAETGAQSSGSGLRERLAGLLRGSGPGRRWRPLAAGLAVVLVVLAGAAGYEVGHGGGGPAHTYTGAEGGITAEVVRQGEGAELNLAHVEPLPPDKVLQAWVQREGEVEPVKALFVPDRDGNASTMIADMNGVEVVMVTREPAGGSPEPTSAPFVQVPIEN
jgi:anti-sigma-K factor RskA